MPISIIKLANTYKNNNKLLQSLIKNSMIVRKEWKPKDGLTRAMKEFIKSVMIDLFNKFFISPNKHNETTSDFFAKVHYSNVKYKLMEKFNLDENMIEILQNELLDIIARISNTLFIIDKEKRLSKPRNYQLTEELKRIIREETDIYMRNLKEDQLENPVTDDNIDYVAKQAIYSIMRKLRSISEYDAAELFNSGSIHNIIKEYMNEYMAHIGGIEPEISDLIDLFNNKKIKTNTNMNMNWILPESSKFKSK